MDKYYINIGRQFCSGGLEIGEKLSKYFSIPYFDKELLNMASKMSGIGKEFFENADEAPSKFKSSFLGLGFASTLGVSDYGRSNIIGGENLFNIQSDVIRDVASKGSAIFIGRCADYILREKKRILNIFIYADINDRVERAKRSKRLQDADSISDKQIAELIKKEDKKRSEYYNYYTFKQWGAIESYDICLDSSKLGIDICLNTILEIVNKKFIR